jgi:hypothetical protein
LDSLDSLFKQFISRNMPSLREVGLPGAIFWAAAGFCVWIVGLAALAIYRLYFSPLAKFPGPKLAALSKWYEGYYEIVHNGKYSREIDRMHDVYGRVESASH